MHWNGIQNTFLLSYYTSKSEQAENSLVLPKYTYVCLQLYCLIAVKYDGACKKVPILIKVYFVNQIMGAAILFPSY